jgi:hypothetical protein
MPIKAGGKNQEWKKFLENIGNLIKKEKSQKKENMEAQKYNVDIKRGYYPPYTYDPGKATFDDIRAHALTKQNKAESTFKKLINLVNLMEKHHIFPVNFKKPHWTNFFQYMDHIKTNEYKEHLHALKNRRDAWAMMCRVWGVYQEWPKYKLPPIPDRTRNIILPMPEKVNELLSYKYTNNPYFNKLIQYHFFYGFYGWNEAREKNRHSKFRRRYFR